MIKDELQMNPHASDAAVGEIPIQKVREVDPPFRNLSELRMIQVIEGTSYHLSSSMDYIPRGHHFTGGYVRIGAGTSSPFRNR